MGTSMKLYYSSLRVVQDTIINFSSKFIIRFWSTFQYFEFPILVQTRSETKIWTKIGNSNYWKMDQNRIWTRDYKFRENWVDQNRIFESSASFLDQKRDLVSRNCYFQPSKMELVQGCDLTYSDVVRNHQLPGSILLILYFSGLLNHKLNRRDVIQQWLQPNFRPLNLKLILFDQMKN